MEPIKLIVPDHKQFGTIENGGKRTYYKLNWKGVSTFLGVVVLIMGFVFTGTKWVLAQTDTTKTVKVLEVRVDSLETNSIQVAVDNTMMWELQKRIYKKIDPIGAEETIGMLEKMRKTRKEQLEKQAMAKKERSNGDG